MRQKKALIFGFWCTYTLYIHKCNKTWNNSVLSVSYWVIFVLKYMLLTLKVEILLLSSLYIEVVSTKFYLPEFSIYLIVGTVPVCTADRYSLLPSSPRTLPPRGEGWWSSLPQDSGGSGGPGHKERSHPLLELGEAKVRNLDVRCDHHCLHIGLEWFHH